MSLVGCDKGEKKMNKVTKDIMKFLECKADYALKVQMKMMEMGVDFSECTKKEFENAVIDADMELLKTTNPFDTIN